MTRASLINLARTISVVLIAVLLCAAGRTAFAAAEADLLVAYDASHASAVGGEDNAQVLAANAVAASNAINDRSGTGARVRITGYHQCAQNNYQRTSKGGFVNWMASYDSRISDVVDAGNARGADLVAFICVSTEDGAAAVAQQPGRYSAFDPGSFWAAVVAHELGGHNYGCDHRGGRENPKTVMMHNYCGGGAAPPYFFSNPNIFMNGVRLRGEGSCIGGAVDGGDNAYLVGAAAQGVADRYARVIAGPSLGNVVRRWSFNQSPANAPAGTTITDSVSGTALATVQGTGATFTGEGLRIPGGASGSGAAYLQLPSGIISGLTNVTIEIWASPLSGQNWARMMDFNNGTANYVMLSSSIGTDLNAQRFEARVGTAVALDSGIPTAAGVLHHYAITFTSTGTNSGRWRWFRDGERVAYLDVGHSLSDLEDVNNWLGRSAFGGDALAHCEYAEVRISDVAMSRDQVLANYSLGPNHEAATVRLNSDDPSGTTSFNAAGNWSDGLPPGAGKTYETYRFRLRTPPDGASRTFAGQTLTIDGGSLNWKGTASSSLTINNLTLSGDCELLHTGSGTWTLAGNMNVRTDEAMVRAANGPVTLSANLSGGGNLLFVNSTVTLSGNNSAFNGKTLVGDGRFGGLAIDSEARLGANPTNFTADQLTLNRGVLFSSSAVTIDDPNRGVRIGVSGGIFNVAPGTTLTLRTPISSPSLGGNIAAGTLIKENSGTLVVAGTNNSFNGPIEVNAGTLAIAGTGLPSSILATVSGGTLLLDSAIGPVVVEAGAALSSSTNINSVSCGALTLESGSAVTMDIGVTSDLIAVNGNLSLAGTLNLRGAGPLVNGAHTLMTYSGTRSGTLALGSVPSGYAFSLDYSVAGQVRLIVNGGLDRAPIVAAGSIWKFNASGADLGTAWRSNNYNDASWLSGAAQIGYGDGGEATVINTSSGKPQIVYFRKAFTLSAQEIGAMSNALLSLLRDDGAVVYLNGAEVRRDNLPEAPATIAYNTPALEAVGGAEENTFYISTFSPARFVAGTNLLAVEVHQSDPGSTDLSFDLILERAVQGGTQIVPVSLISTGAVWKYFVQAVDLGSSWRSNSFNDAAWNSGPSMLGFGDANGLLPATVVASNGQWTSYFRRSFVAPDTATLQSLSARILRDDAAVVYLNGAEVWRDENLPSTGAINYNTPAQAGLGGADESTWIPFTLNPAALQNGTNLIAIEVHQNSTTSSDLALNFDLAAAMILPNHSQISINGNMLSWPASAGGLGVYSTTNLIPPVSWSPVSGNTYQSNTVWYLPLPQTTNGQMFYRLQFP